MAARTDKSRLARRLRDERGFSLVELLVTMLLSATGVAATIKVFGASGRTTAIAQQSEVAVHKAEAEIDRLSKLAYGELALTSTPAHSTDPVNPHYRVNGPNFDVHSSLSEPLVTTPAAGSTAQVAPGGEAFTVGSGGSAISGQVYRYVTWRDERCPAGTGLCDGTQNTKRVTVAVTVDPSPGVAARRPVWLSTVLADPAASGPTTSTGSTATGPNTSAQQFYLYDTPCQFTVRQTPAGDHDARSTAATGSLPADNSTCQNSDATKNPDLMWTAAPTGAGEPLYRYSADLGGTYPGGLAMTRTGTSCRSSYASTDSSAKWSVHAWSTNQFSSPFILSGRITLSVFTTALDSLSGAGKICATLVERSESGGIASDTVIDAATHDVANWPTTTPTLSFTRILSSPHTVPVNRRLVLVLHVRSESAQDLAFLYDHQSYPSLLEVETSTPL